jgi:acetyl-CoA carboxylase carboxyl transferase subunit beta
LSNWLTNFIRPKIRSIVGAKDVPDNLWQKCPSCDGMLFNKDLQDNLNVCYHCGHHLKISVKDRLTMLFDHGQYQIVRVPDVPADPLKFKDKKKYTDRLKDSIAKTGEKDAILVAEGQMGQIPVVIAAFNFDFMGGSMGATVGEGLVKAAELAVQRKAALIAIPASGGARMQEGIVSLIQMPRTTIAVQMVKDAGLPYFVLLTDPTTGGVSASFAMLGDIHIAEPGSMIGFAGKRVIEETIREQLPADFQTAEYLKDHGMVDMVVERKNLRETFIRLLSLIMLKDQRSGRYGSSSSSQASFGTQGTNKGSSPSNSIFRMTQNNDGLKDLPQPANLAANQVSAPKLAKNK